MRPLDERIRQAPTAGPEELWQLIKDAHPDVLINAVYNRNFTEDMAVFIAKRRNMPPEGLGMLATDVRFRDSYQLKLRLCRNPRTPQRVVFSLLKFIRIFDLADMTRDQNIPVTIRQRIEVMITERLRGMPSGIKKTLARKANAAILLAIMERADEEVIRGCLDNPSLTEGHVCRIINRPATGGHVIRQIALHEKWALRYYVKFALIRNFHTPMPTVVKFVSAMKTQDLRDLYADPQLPSSTRPFIFRELRERGEEAGPQDEVTFSLSGDEDAMISDDADKL